MSEMASNDWKYHIPSEGLLLTCGTLILYVAYGLYVGLFNGTYPPILFSTAILLSAQIIVMRRFGVVSPVSLFSVLMVVPGLVPFIAKYIFSLPNLTLKANRFETTAAIQQTLFLVTVFSAIYTVVLLLQPLRKAPTDRTISFYPRKLPVLVIIILNLTCAYLTTPGPTILTVNYATVLNNTYSWATFAGSLYLGSWIVLYLLAQESQSRYFLLFLVITVIGAGWLLLHSRRAESLGILVVLVIDWYYNYGSSIVYKIAALLSSGSLFLIAIVIGQVRSAWGGLSTLSNIFIGNNQSIEYLRLPGGAHNVFGTFLATIQLAGNEVQYYLGESFIMTPVYSIPGAIYSIFDLYRPLAFGDFKSAYSPYNGGNYFNLFYANFGEVGVILGATVLALAVLWSQNELFSIDTSLRTGVAAVIVAGSFRAMWYTPLNWIDFLQGFLVTAIIYIILSNVETIYRTTVES